MYSASIIKEDILLAKKEAVSERGARKLVSALTKANSAFLSLKKRCVDFTVLEDIGDIIDLVEIHRGLLC